MPSKIDRLMKEFDYIQDLPPGECDVQQQKWYREVVVALREAQMYVALDGQGRPAMRFALEDKALKRKLEAEGMTVVKAVVVIP